MNITNSKCLPIAVILFLFLSISSCTDNDQNSFYKEKFRESSSDNKDLKFERIKNEITEINSKGVYLSANHSDRIKHELNYFKQRGYSADEIEELLQIVIKLSPNTQNQTKEQESSEFKWIPPSTCSGDKIMFSKSPVELSEILYIVPMGQVAADHVTPTDHGYIINSQHSPPLKTNFSF